jgi:uncharacterized protein (TIGR04222 family)
LLAGVLVVCFGVPSLLAWRKGATRKGSELDAYEVAYLTGGPDRAVESALASLIQNRVIEASSSKGRFKVVTELPQEAHSFEQSVVDILARHATRSIRDFRRSLASELEDISERLTSGGLTISSSARSGIRKVFTATVLALTLFGFIKVMVGIDRDRPVTYLGWMLLGTQVVHLLPRRIPLRTSGGSRVLRDLQRRNYALKTTAKSNRESLSGLDAAMTLGLFGVAAWGSYSSLNLPFPAGRASSSGGSAGCGGAACGSSCGGGCGGGCGGCGA